MSRAILTLIVIAASSIAVDFFDTHSVWATNSPNAPVDSGAPMWGVDFANSWQSPFSFPSTRPQIVWEKAVDFTNAFPTAITVDDADGLFIPGTSQPFRRRISTGDPDPNAPVTVNRSSTAAHSQFGQTYLWLGGTFQARDSQTGALLWTGVPSNVSDGLPPKIGPDGNIYAPEISGQVFKYSPDGTLLFESVEYGNTGLNTGMVPAIDGQSNIYFANGARVISLDANGNERWSIVASVAGGTNFTPLILGPNGLVYHTEFRAIVGRDAKTGEVVTQIEELGRLEAISRDGAIYVMNPFVGIRAINLDGTERWNFERRAFGFQSLIVDSVGKVLASDEFGNLVALSSYGELLWEIPLADNAFPLPNPPVILADGRILVQQRASAFLLAVPEPPGAVLGLLACIALRAFHARE